MAMNTPVQGTAADIMKMAMVSVARMRKIDAHLVLQVPRLVLVCRKPGWMKPWPSQNVYGAAHLPCL